MLDVTWSVSSMGAMRHLSGSPRCGRSPQGNLPTCGCSMWRGTGTSPGLLVISPPPSGCSMWLPRDAVPSTVTVQVVAAAVSPMRHCCGLCAVVWPVGHPVGCGSAGGHRGRSGVAPRCLGSGAGESGLVGMVAMTTAEERIRSANERPSRWWVAGSWSFY